MPLIIGAKSASATYTVDNSCRVNRADTPSITKDNGTPSSETTGTISFWLKRCILSVGDEFVLDGRIDANNRFKFAFNSSDIMEFWNSNGGSDDLALISNRKFRDVSAWYHFVIRIDTTQSTAADRVRVYVNGVNEADVGGYSTETYPAQDSTDTVFFEDSAKQTVGAYYNGSAFTYPYDGYLAEVVYCDGQSLAPTEFGEFDEDSPTIWKPKDVSGLTFGNNGFYLDFEDSADLGADVSGNSNDLTVANLDAADQTTDTPTNNFATLNPLGFAGTIPTFSQGNLNVTVGTSDSLYSVSTIGVSSGKWYVEGEIEQAGESGGLYYTDFGFADRADSGGTSLYTSAGRLFWHASWDGGIYYRTGGSTASPLVTGLATFAPGDFFQLYLDMDNELMYWGKDGSLLNSTGVSFNGKESLTGEYFVAFGDQYTASTTEYAVNFGQGSIDGSAVSNYNDVNGYGNFKYDPSVTTDEGAKDFLAICTKNLGAYGG